MSTTRQDFVSDLQETFTKHPEIYAECITSSHDLLRRGLTSRVFEEFPQLLPNKIMKDVTQKYRNILLAVTRKPNNDLELYHSEKKSLSNLESQLGALSANALLNEERQIKPHLISLLKWDEFQKQLKTQELVVGFLATVNHQVQLELKELIATNPTASAMINNYVDHEKNSWAKEAITRKKDNHLNIYLGASALGALTVGFTALTIYGLYTQGSCLNSMPEKNLPNDVTSRFFPNR